MKDFGFQLQVQEKADQIPGFGLKLEASHLGILITPSLTFHIIP